MLVRSVIASIVTCPGQEAGRGRRHPQNASSTGEDNLIERLRLCVPPAFAL